MINIDKNKNTNCIYEIKKTTFMYDDLNLFIQIVQNQGLAKAAEKLNISAATITRRLQKLEQSLNVQLIHRSARQFILTSEGQNYYQTYAPLFEQLETSKNALINDSQTTCGPLKVFTPTNISLGFLQPMWSDFIKSYPEIQLELQLNNQVEDLLEAKADIALRIGPQSDAQLYQKKLGSLSTLFVASPRYLDVRGEPKQLEDLNKHTLLATHTLPDWHLEQISTGKVCRYHPKISTRTNDVSLIALFVCDGIGISLLPINEARSHIESGAMVQILKDWKGPERELFAVWSTGRLLNPRAKLLKQHMQDFIQIKLNEF